ncbi:MAG: hypothetical protein ACFUZC_17975 [Chthoniobacteraceae bacterium]
MRPRLLLFALLLVVAFVQSAQAQFQVSLDIKRRFLMVYEPIVATVTVANLSGRDVTLTDSPTQSWFGFQVNYGDVSRIVPPNDPFYRQPPLTIAMGQTIKRSVVLNNLFPMGELGLYRVRATIFDSAREKYYQSPVIGLELSEGKVVWQQNAGVPSGYNGAGGTRKVSLLTFRKSESTYLYVRVEDPDNAVVFCTLALGRIISGIDPEMQFDGQNVLNVLQLIGQKTYLFTRISLDGEVISQETYTTAKYRPTLRRDASGSISVYGGTATRTGAPGDPGEKVPNKLSDRPVPVPAE